MATKNDVKKLRDQVKEGGNGVRWIHIQLPCTVDHNTHPIGGIRIQNYLKFMYL